MNIIETTVKEVQIYRHGAAVIREGSVHLQKGLNHIYIAGMRGGADTRTMKLFIPEGITGSNIRVINPVIDLKTEERKTDGIKERIELVSKQIETCESLQELWINNGSIQGKEGVSLKETEEYLENLPERLLKLHEKVQRLVKDRKQLEKELEEAAEEETNLLISIDLDAEEEGTYTFVLQYHDYQASWQPVYEVHSQGKESDVEIKVKAGIKNSTNEDWKGVKVTLFTGNPSISEGVPELKPLYLNIAPEIKVRSFAMNGMMAASAMVMEDAVEEDAETTSLKVVEEEAAVTSDETMTEYILPGKRDIYATEEGVLADLQKFSLKTEYEVIAVPKMDPHAYLCAKIRNKDLPVMINGTAGVYYKGTYTGTVQFSPQMSEEESRISFGSEERIHIERKEAALKNSTALLKNQRIRTHEYEIVVTSRKDEPVSLVVYDQIPVSQDKTIEVELLKKDEGILNEKTGEIKWNVTLGAMESKVLNLSYRISWPKDKNLQETRTSRRRFCPSCGASVPEGKFCPVCGERI